MRVTGNIGGKRQGGWIGAAIAAAGAIGGGILSSKGAKSAAKQATPRPYSTFGPAGGFSVDPKTRQIELSMAANPFASMFNALGASSFANAAVAPGQFLHGANSEVANAYRGTFGQGLTGEIQGQLDLLRQAAAPQENRDRLALDDQLFSRGMLGTTGGAERFRALMESQGQNDLQRQLAAVGLGQTNALNRLQGAMGATQQGMAGQQQAFNIGQGAFGGMQGLFQNLINQGQLGLGAASGTPPGIAQWAAQQSQVPYQAGFNFLNQSGVFDRLGGLFGGGGNASYPGGTVPMVNQPNMGPINIGGGGFQMPSGNFGL